MSAPYLNENYKQLGAAILCQAVRDAESGIGHSRSARLWLRHSSWASDLMDVLGLERTAVLAWVDDLAPEMQMQLPGL